MKSRTVFVSGHFNVLHPGHLRLLRFAKEYGDRLVYSDRPYGALEGANGLAIVTEWQEFRNPDFEVMRRLLKEPVVFDGRNLYEPANMARLGFVYHSIGRQAEVVVK